jgi:hypothetical protein
VLHKTAGDVVFPDLNKRMFGVNEHTVSGSTFSWSYFINMSRLDQMSFDIDPLCHSSIVMIHLIGTCILLPTSPLSN